jgi:iron complex outermembrane recepter protein
MVAAGIVWLAGAAQGVSAQAAASTGDQGAPPESTLNEVIVTAQLVSQSIIDVPETITAFTSKDLRDFNIQTFTDYATKVPNLNFTYGQGGLTVTESMSIAIDGISGVNTTGFYINDTPVPDTINPTLVDIKRIEVLKGPQGTLFGAASMGGNVRLITDTPDVNSNYGTYTVQGGGTSGGGSPDYGGQGEYNFVVVPSKLAIQLTGFYQHDAGFLTNTFPSASGMGESSLGDQGGLRTYGGSIAARWRVSDNFDATLSWRDQTSLYQGLREAYAPLPEFLPVYILPRTTDSPEGAYNKFSLTSLDLNYHLKNVAFTSSTSYFYNNADEFENGTEGTVETVQEFYNVTLNDRLPMPYDAPNNLNQFTEEDRVSATLNDAWSLVGGLYYMRQWGSGGILNVIVPGLAANDLYPTNLLYNGLTFTTQNQEAAFGQVYYKFFKRFKLTLGGRLYKLRQTYASIADGFFNGGYSDSGLLHSSQSGVSPKVALSFATSKDSNVYASYATGFRPGGAQIPPPPFCFVGVTAESTREEYQSDKVDNYQLGFKTGVPEGGYFTASLFETFWKNMQQVVVLPCGYPYTENTGEARIHGVDLEFEGRVVHNLYVHAGLGLLSAVVTNQGEGLVEAGEPIFQVPKVNGTLGLVYSLPHIASARPYISVDYSYVGSRISDNNTVPTPLQEPGYGILNSEFGFDITSWRLDLYLKNITNAKPNLGDIQQIDFPQYLVGANGTHIPYLEVALMPPFQVGLQITHDF